MHQCATPPSKDEQEKIDEWDKEELTIHYMLSQKLLDSIVIRIHKLATVAEKWKLVEEEFMCKGLFAHADLCNTFMASQCPCGENVQHFLMDLGTKWEELVTSGIEISNADYRSTILSSIPPWLKTYASGIQASASVKDPTFEIEPDILIHMISEEYDCVKWEKGPSTGTHQWTPHKDEDVALAAAPTPQSNRPPHILGVCWNCGQSRHLHVNCPKLHKLHSKPNHLPPVASVSKSIKPPNIGVVNTVVLDNDEGDGVWAVFENEDAGLVKLSDKESDVNEEDLEGESF